MPSISKLNQRGAEKFGKVIFAPNPTDNNEQISRGGAGGGGGDGGFGMLPTIRFSNLDLKWYDARQDDKQVHEETYGANIGKTVSFRCSLSVEDQHGEMCNRGMTFLLPEKLGELVGPNLELVENGTLRLTEQAKRSGYSKEEIDRTIKRLEGGSLPAFAGVGKNSGELMLHILWMLVFVWDDDIDNNDREEFKQYEQLEKIISCMIDALRGNEISVEGMSPAAAALVGKHQRVYQLMREEALQAGARYGCDPSPVLDDLAEYLSSVVLELSLEWNAQRQSGSQMFQRVQRVNRELTAGVGPTLENFALVEGISVKASIRGSFLFKNFKSLVTQHVTLVNDLFSYAKEVANGEASNILYLHHVERGLSMEKSLARIEGEINQVAEAMREVGQLLGRLYKGDEGVLKFVKLGMASSVGHIQWYSNSRRYYPELVFDMIVH